MINGTCLRNAIISGANNIAKHKTSVDELNIFPVPDGDTGTNMSMTMSSAAAALKKMRATRWARWRLPALPLCCAEPEETQE